MGRGTHSYVTGDVVVVDIAVVVVVDIAVVVAIGDQWTDDFHGAFHSCRIWSRLGSR